MKPSKEYDHLQYKVITSTQLTSLENQVASMMCKSFWEPYGNLVITDSGRSIEYYQVMIYNHDKASSKN